jgi:DNA-binding IclR family transcriptional regulator
MSENERGVQTLETGGEILRCFLHAVEPMTVTAIVRATGMPPGKVHRYLHGFIGAGLLAHDPATRRYDLGPLAFSLGASALRRHDVVRAASDHLAELCTATGESVSLQVWGDRAPVIIRSEECREYVAIVLRVGATVRMTTSSAGALFAAYLPSPQTKAIIEAELALKPIVHGRIVTARCYATTLEEVRRRGFSTIDNGPPGNAVAVSAPLFAAAGRFVGGISVVGRAGFIASEPEGAVERELGAFVARMQQIPGRKSP